MGKFLMKQNTMQIKSFLLRRKGLHLWLAADLILLAGFYLCPILFAALISGTMAVYLGWKFNVHTGTHTMAAGYFGLAFLLFLCVYAVYFVVTYVGFLRNALTKA